MFLRDPGHRKAQALLSVILICLVLSLVTAANAAEAELDQTEIFLGEGVVLTLQANDQWADIDLDLNPLTADFQILGVTTGTRLRIIKGRLLSITSWRIHLRPEHTGSLRIPPIVIGEDTTPALALVVLPERTQQDPSGFTLLETSLLPEQPYVQAQAIYRLRILFTGKLQYSDVVIPPLQDLSLQPLGAAEVSVGRRGNTHFQVWQQNYALFPERSGELILPEIRVTAHLAQAESVRHRMRNRNVEFKTLPRTITVRPKPATFTGKDWLPARDLTIHMSRLDRQPRVGEIVRYTLTIEAKGLRGIQLPMLPNPELQQAHIYPEPPQISSVIENGSILGRSRQTIALMPLQAGVLQLPEIRLNWWDTQQEQSKTSILPAQVLHVLPGNI